MALSISGKVNLNGMVSMGAESFTPIDPYYSSVSLLMHYDGVNDSTSFIDSSTPAKTVLGTPKSNVKLSNVQSKFGGTSLVSDTSQAVSMGITSSLFAFGSGNFTVEGWAYYTGGDIFIFSTWPAANTSNGVSLRVSSNGTGSFYIGNASGAAGVSNNYLTTTVGFIPINTWVYLAGTRNGNTMQLFVNGTLIGSTGTTRTVNSQGWGLARAYSDRALAGDMSTGYIDEVRVTTGVARYTATYAVPTAAFPNQ